MAQRRHHYERAFEEYLRSRRIPYVSVDEARKALVPPTSSSTKRTNSDAAGTHGEPSTDRGRDTALKSFDFVIYGQDGNLLIDIKGRRVASRGRMDPSGRGGVRASPTARSRLESWVTREDVDSLTRWEQLFEGDGPPHGPAASQFRAAFVFVYWCVEQPPDALFQEVFEYRGRWYALRAVTLDVYKRVMKPRSVRWRTVDIPSAVFERVSQPFAPPPVHAAAQSGRRPPDHRMQLCSLDDPEFSAELGGGSRNDAIAGSAGSRQGGRRDEWGGWGPQLPALHPYDAPVKPSA